ncbi:MAG TPA: hypothetical protein VF131_17025 [Blastocatellia bacterium]|nr:hypothetical protein [Blastocatellia bacterium]
MALIGDLLYPDNADMARELNKEQLTLEKTNALHNDMVDTYRSLAEEIGTFDSYLMAVMVMQYHLAYAKEDLENLPDTNMPRLTESIAEKIESLALDAVSVKMAYNGLKALGNRIGNIVQESGSYKSSFSNGGKAFEAEIQPELDSIRFRSGLLRSGNIDLLTRGDTDAADLGDMAKELEVNAGDLNEGDGGESGEMAETSESVTSGAEAATEASQAAVGAGEAAAEVSVEAATEAGASVLGPAAIILIVVTEIIGAIDAAETHDKLEKALKDMRNIQKLSDKSLATLRKAFKSLLKSAKLDIITYNRLLLKLYQLESNSYYQRSFGTSGLESLINGFDLITIDNTGGLPGYKTVCSADLNAATDFIRGQAEHDSEMTDVISKIKTHIKAEGLTDVDDAFLQSLAEVENIEVNLVNKYNKFRKFIAEFASTLKPFHDQIRQETLPDSKEPVVPKNPNFGEPDPNFDPNPNDFTVPALPKSNAA